MGKGTITEDKGEGLYAVDLDYGSDDISQRVANLAALIVELTDSLASNQSLLFTKKLQRSVRSSLLDVAIGELKVATDANREIRQAAVNRATESFQEIAAEILVLEDDIHSATYAKKAAEVKVAALNEIITSDSRGEVWCTTYTEEATGDVGTIEIDGEQPKILIAPEAADYSPSVHGDFRHRLAMSGAATYLNAALLPGWQKYQPTYRVGTLTGVDYTNDTCSVTLDAATSSSQGLNINLAEDLTDVPIVYLDCNASVFDLDDRVVVRFIDQDPEQPQVIGFETNPKPCSADIWASGTIVESSFLYHIATRLTQDLEIVDEYKWLMNTTDGAQGVARIKNSDAVVSFLDLGSEATGSTFNVRLRDIKNGAVRFTSPFSVFQGNAEGVSIDNSQDRLYLRNIDRGIDVYRWSTGALLGTYTVPDSDETTVRDIDSNGDVFVGLNEPSRSTGESAILTVFAVDAETLVQEWSVDLTDLTIGPSLLLRSVSVSSNYVAVAFTGSIPDTTNYASILAVIDVATGEVLRQDRYFVSTGAAADFDYCITLRGRKAFLASAKGGSPSGVQNRIRYFDVLDGDPTAPDGELDDIFPTHANGNASPFID